jgi:hypothetical protein
MHVTNVMGQHFFTAWTYVGLSGVFPVNQLLLCKVRHDSYACLITVTQPVELPSTTIIKLKVWWLGQNLGTRMNTAYHENLPECHFVRACRNFINHGLVLWSALFHTVCGAYFDVNSAFYEELRSHTSEGIIIITTK